MTHTTKLGKPHVRVVGGTDYQPEKPSAKKSKKPVAAVDEIERHARPGESREQALQRLNAQPVLARESSDKEQWDPEIALCARELVMVTLPHSDPGADKLVFQRRNGNLVLQIQPGVDPTSGRSIGIPYGSIPRLILYYIVTEINRTGGRRVSLGKNWSELAVKLGLDSESGGKKGSIRYLQEQLRRLLAARISFIFQDHRNANLVGECRKDFVLANQSIRWWNPKNPGQALAMESWIVVGEEFFKAVTHKPIPMRLATVSELKKSPLALDLYALLCRESALAVKNAKGRVIAWKWLQEQLGAEYDGADGLKNFARKATKALRMIQQYYPKLRAEIVRGGIEILDDTLPDVEKRF